MKKLGIILFGLMLLTQPLQAQPWTPTMAPWIADGATVTYTYSGVSDIAVGNAWGFMGGPYEASLISPTSPMVTVYCVDFYTLVANGGRVITAEALALTNPANFPVMQRWGSRTTMAPVPIRNFAKAAYLASLFPQFQGNAAAIKAIQGAMWVLTSNPAHVAADVDVQRALAMAEEGYGSYEHYDQWRLLRTTAVGEGRSLNEFGQSQHFLVQTQTVTPEPQTYILLGSGLLFLVFVGRRRLKENGYS